MAKNKIISTTKAITSFKLFIPIIIIAGIILIGVIGFMIIEGYNLLDAVYMTITTITTVGYQEVHPLSETGRIFNILLITSSFIASAYALTKLTQYIIDGEINKFFKTRKLMASLKEMHNHVIVCGYGRNGKQAANILGHHNVKFVIIENDDERIEEEFSDNSILYLKGDATNDQVLLDAGIERARALITALPEDADNVFIVLSARSLNNNIQIISRASNSSSAPKLRKAGANSVIMPDTIGGTHMATLVSKPDVIEFIDYLSGEEGDSIHLEAVDFNILPIELQNKSLQEIMAWRKTGVNCIGIKNSDGKFIINPNDITVIEEGMKVIVLGTRQQIEEMKGNVEASERK